MEIVRGIGFDLDHTLAIDNRLERIAFLRLLERVLAQGAHHVGTLADEIENIDDLLVHQRRAEFTIDEAVRRFVAAHGVEPTESHVDWFRDTAVAMVDELVVPLPGVRATLQRLAEREIPVAILTNGWNPMQRRKAQRAGFSGPILVSSEIGIQKPAAAAFEVLLQILGTAPGETWYVGDDPRGDIGGAQATGMYGIWLDWERKEYPPDVPAPLQTIQHFEELLDLLPATVQMR
jgi:putative hydrolase of the HAD superfamily